MTSDNAITHGPRKDWDGHAHVADWLKWLGHLKGKPAHGLEVGTFLGESAEWMLENIFTNEDSRYSCVDTFQGSAENRLAGMDCSGLYTAAHERLSRFQARVAFYIGESRIVLREMRGESLDFALIDGAHDAQNVLRDGVLAFDLLKVGGIMVFDDYEWALMPDAIDQPKMAVQAFLACYGRQCEVIGLGSQCAVRKLR